MESMPKRARSTTLDPERLDVWNRMVKKLMALVIPINLLMEQALRLPTGNHKKMMATLVEKMEMEDLIHARELIAVQIRKLQLCQDLRDSEDFIVMTDLDDVEVIEPTSMTSRTPTTPATATSRTLTTRRAMPAASSSLAPSEAMTQGSTGTNGAGKVGDVKGLEIVFGYIPPCHCGHQARLHLSRTEKNIEKFFLRCPRDPGVQCNYFQWTTAQPFQDVTAWKYKDQGEGAVPAAEALQDIVQNTCQHKNTTKQGSNGDVERVTCKMCGKLLSVKSRKEIKEKKTSSSAGTTADFEEYQKFLEWKKHQKK